MTNKTTFNKDNKANGTNTDIRSFIELSQHLKLKDSLFYL